MWNTISMVSKEWQESQVNLCRSTVEGSNLQPSKHNPRIDQNLELIKNEISVMNTIALEACVKVSSHTHAHTQHTVHTHLVALQLNHSDDADAYITRMWELQGFGENEAVQREAKISPALAPTAVHCMMLLILPSPPSSRTDGSLFKLLKHKVVCDARG
jgi:hypothetical protein